MGRSRGYVICEYVRCVILWLCGRGVVCLCAYDVMRSCGCVVLWLWGCVVFVLCDCGVVQLVGDVINNSRGG